MASTRLRPMIFRVAASGGTAIPNSVKLSASAAWMLPPLSTKVPSLLPLIRRVRAVGGIVEHVYDY